MATTINQTGTDTFVRDVIQKYRTKLLDLTNRNPLISFRHSERSRSHIRLIDEIPEILFKKLADGRSLRFEPLPDPELVPPEENSPQFKDRVRTAESEDQAYQQAVAELGPNASPRQINKIKRELRNRIRTELGWDPFQPTWDPARRARECGLRPEYELPEMNGQTARRYTDSRIQVLFFSEDLDRKLGGLREAVRVLERDAGINALYCAFGFLEYYPSNVTDEKRLAPLVLLPISIDRVLVEHQYWYSISSRNEDIQINVALAQLLKEMAIDIPGWPDDDEDDDNPLGRYLGLVQQAISSKPDWRVRRYVTIGLFTFSTLAMYEDLDAQRWPADAPLEQQPVLRTLVAGAETCTIQYAEDYEIDNLKGPEPLLITDADSSQYSAVIDVLRGRSSQVIQGPPGTGKSQTITNIIAAALHENLSVLFVAEKMAALEVVKKRLDAAGLEAFCLELHSSKTSKTAVIQSLAQRLAYRPPTLDGSLVQSNADALLAARNDLLYYVQHVNQDAGQTGRKIYDILLGSAIRDERRSELPEGITEARFADPLEITLHRYRRMLDSAATLETQMRPLAEFGQLADHPWRGFQNVQITELEESRLKKLFLEWTDAIRRLLELLSSIAWQTGSPMPGSIVELEEFCRRVSEMPPPPVDLRIETYKACACAHNRNLLRQVLECFETLSGYEAKLTLHTDNLAGTRYLGSGALDEAVQLLRKLGMEEFTVASLMESKEAFENTAAQTARLESVCSALCVALGIPDSSIASIRAAVVATELLKKLPRPLWSKRSAAIFDEANRSLFEQATEKARALRQSRTRLEAQFELQLLPSAGDLRRHSSALRSANAFSALFSSACRQAKRVYRGIARHGVRKSRDEMARALMQCARYLTDTEAFNNRDDLKAVCGPNFDGVDTPFSELLQIAQWGDEVRHKLASEGEAGRQAREVLFNGSVDQLDILSGIAAQPAFSLLRNVVTSIDEDDRMTWGELVQLHRSRSDMMNSVADVFQRAALKNLSGLEELLSVADTLRFIEKTSAIMEGNPDALKLAGGTLESLREGFDSFRATLEFAEDIFSWSFPTPLISHFFADPSHIAGLQSTAKELERACTVVVDRQKETDRLAQFDALLWCGSQFEQVVLERLERRNQRALDHIAALRDYLNFLLAEAAARDEGTGPVLSVYLNAGLDYNRLPQAVEFVFYRSAAEAILNADPRLRTHTGATHEDLRKRFRELDREYLELRRKELAIKLSKRDCPPGNSCGPVATLTELALITRVAGQTRPRISVRDLVRRAGNAMQALKPCWMMSPMSVAQYLEPGKLTFDLVIMDEASQIRPEEALGGIARGQKAVIVGDQMQLPPTPFFQRLSTGGAADDDESEEETRQESVLEAAAGRFHPCRRLKWHYRSEHGSLISYSNSEFYDNQLTIFPSPYDGHPEFGVSLVQTKGIYDGGMNQIEGTAVVKAAIEFMNQCPDRSLGIVAINSKQAEFIREELDREVAVDADAAAFVQRWDQTLEALFVKNLENVQGDERDVIFISTVYGKDRNGNFYQRFGPINGIYGHRRLNVLFTRAKKRVTVFTSMVPEEIHEEGKHWGVKVLKGYLQFAREGIAPTTAAGGECESEFERWVLDVLRVHGYEAVPQLGVCGYRIDIAVRDPDRPGVFLCGVECDGATYHSARCVRERDRLRQEILERHGWNLYRIWSTDWFRNPRLQTRQLLDYLQRSRH